MCVCVAVYLYLANIQNLHLPFQEECGTTFLGHPNEMNNGNFIFRAKEFADNG